MLEKNFYSGVYEAQTAVSKNRNFQTTCLTLKIKTQGFVASINPGVRLDWTYLQCPLSTPV
jgi:hypothetical protein